MGTQASQATFRSYLFFWAGQLISLFGSSIAGFVIIWWITWETKSTIFLSIASFAGFAPMVLLTPIAGVYADRWNRKALIGIVDFLQALATVILILLFWWNIASVWHVIGLSVVRAVFGAFHSPAVSALIPLMVPRDKLSRINGLNYLLSGAVNLIGPLVAAPLLEIWRIYEILWIDAGTFIVALIPLLMIAIPSVRKKQEESKDKPSFRKEFVEGLAFVKSRKGLLALIVLATVLNFLIMPMNTLYPYFIMVDHLGDASNVAFVVAFFQGGMLAGGLLMSVKKEFKRRMTLMTSVLYVQCLGYAMAALTPTGAFWFMAIGALIMGSTFPVGNVLIQTIIQTIVPVEIFGRVNSVMISLANVASPAGMVLSGLMAELIGTVNLFLACSIAMVLSLTLSWIFSGVRHLDKIEAHNEEEEHSQPN